MCYQYELFLFQRVPFLVPPEICLPTEIKNPRRHWTDSIINKAQYFKTLTPAFHTVFPRFFLQLPCISLLTGDHTRHQGRDKELQAAPALERSQWRETTETEHRWGTASSMGRKGGRNCGKEGDSTEDSYLVKSWKMTTIQENEKSKHTYVFIVALYKIAEILKINIYY